MTDGHWTIKQYAPTSKTGFTVTVIPITRTPNDNAWTDEPHWYHADWGIKFFYADGHKEFFPWASIVHAEYQPPTNPQEGGNQ